MTTVTNPFQAFLPFPAVRPKISTQGIMSSVQTAFSQIGPREKYFITTVAGAVKAPAVNVAPGNSAAGGLDTLVSQTDFTAGSTANTTTLVAGLLLKDLGRSITVYDDTTLLKVAVYRKVAVVSGGPTSEGDATFDPAADIYALVWTTNTAVKVGVARVG